MQEVVNLEGQRDNKTSSFQNSANSKTNLTLVIIGNSWAGNGMNTIFEQCKGAFRNIYSAWTPGNLSAFYFLQKFQPVSPL